MILFAVLAVVIGIFSPFWGLIFITATGYKYYPRKYVFYAVFAGVVLFLGVLFPNTITTYTAYDLIFGVGIASYLIFVNIYKDFDYLRTILQVTFFYIVFGVIRYLLFQDVLTENINFIFSKYNEIIMNTYQGNEQQMEIIRRVSENLREFFINFNPAIWIVTITVGAYLGLLLLSHKIFIKWEHKTIQMPFALIYLLLVALIFVLSDTTRKFGLNGLLVMAPLFMIQGFSLLHYYWGDFLKKYKLLLILLILAFIFNPYLLLLLILIGFVDIWFNFRKIHIDGGN
ncbi:MAG: DUF2232 domain-containing protein [Candidatus Cloacimonadota bacterium]|nr:DUF2232 domain-containing protein [Candidatus Cloacimonadota bacterium]